MKPKMKRFQSIITSGHNFVSFSRVLFKESRSVVYSVLDTIDSIGEVVEGQLGYVSLNECPDTPEEVTD